jgi:hypothetical protein
LRYAKYHETESRDTELCYAQWFMQSVVKMIAFITLVVMPSVIRVGDVLSVTLLSVAVFSVIAFSVIMLRVVLSMIMLRVIALL